MNNCGSTAPQMNRVVLDVDLNSPLPTETWTMTSPQESAARANDNSSQVEATDHIELVISDDVVIISRRKFEEAKSNAQRCYSRRRVGNLRGRGDGRGVHNCVSGCPINFSPGQDHRIMSQDQSMSSLKLNLVQVDNSKTKKIEVPPTAQEAPPTFSCAICIGELTQATSTKCGHIFCKMCIEDAIKFQHKCPVCRRKLRKNDIHRVYLPVADEKN